MEREESLNGVRGMDGAMLDNPVDNAMNGGAGASGAPSGDINPIYTQGTMQSILTSAKGEFARCEFLIGSNNIVEKEGIIYSVGISYFVLLNLQTNEYIVCDLYAVKFVNVPRTNVGNFSPSSGSNNNSRRRGR